MFMEKMLHVPIAGIMLSQVCGTNAARKKNLPAKYANLKEGVRTLCGMSVGVANMQYAVAQLLGNISSWRGLMEHQWWITHGDPTTSCRHAGRRHIHSIYRMVYLMTYKYRSRVHWNQTFNTWGCLVSFIRKRGLQRVFHPRSQGQAGRGKWNQLQQSNHRINAPAQNHEQQWNQQWHEGRQGEQRSCQSCTHGLQGEHCLNESRELEEWLLKWLLKLHSWWKTSWSMHVSKCY